MKQANPPAKSLVRSKTMINSFTLPAQQSLEKDIVYPVYKSKDPITESLRIRKQDGGNYLTVVKKKN